MSNKSAMPPLWRYINADGAGLEYMLHILSQHISQIEVYPSHPSTSSSSQNDINWTYKYIYNVAGATIEIEMDVPNVSDIQIPHERELSRSE